MFRPRPRPKPEPFNLSQASYVLHVGGPGVRVPDYLIGPLNRALRDLEDVAIQMNCTMSIKTVPNKPRRRR